MSNSVIKYIKNPINISILCQIYCDEKYNYEKMSDFELFDLWEKSHSYMRGHDCLCGYMKVLEEHGMRMLCVGEYSRDKSCKRWRELNKMLLFEGETEEAVKYSDAEGSRLDRKEYDFFECDLNEILTKNINYCDDLFALSNNVSNIINGLNISVNSIYIDLSQCEYSRPDVYSAELAFRRIKSGEKLNCSEKFVLLSELAITALSKNKNLALHIGGANALTCIVRFVSYLYGQSLFEGRAFVDVESNTDLSPLSDITARVYPKIAVRPYLIDSKYDSTDALKKLFAKYPIGAFCFEGYKNHHLLDNVTTLLLKAEVGSDSFALF